MITRSTLMCVVTMLVSMCCLVGVAAVTLESPADGAPARRSTSSLHGVFKGRVVGDPVGKYSTRLSLRRAAAGHRAATVSYSLGCSGTWTFTRRSGDEFSFSERITHDPQDVCAKKETVLVYQLTGGKLLVLYNASGRNKGYIRAELAK